MRRAGAPVGPARDARVTRSLWVTICRRVLHSIVLIILLFSPFSDAQTAAGPGDLRNQISRVGRLTLTWGDGKPGSEWSMLLVSLVDDAGDATILENDPQSLGKILGLNRRQVVAVGRWIEEPGLAGQVLRVNSLQLDEKSEILSASVVGSASAISGPQPWVNVLCKFADVVAEPESLSYFDGLLGEEKPGLGHYWREVSYDQINILGSASYGWYTLPQPRAHYLGFTASAMLTELFNDCTAVADRDIHFPDFVGINLMFNAELDGSAWGGSRWTTLDGQSRFWYTTWEPPWGYGNQVAMAHEMGHGFGLPHSSGDYGVTYDNQWDLMSDIWSNCYKSIDATYGCLAQHTISYYKDILDWIPNGERFMTTAGNHAITLEQQALPQTGNYKIAVIPIGGSSTHFYTVEARRLIGYDIKLPDSAVILHEVDTTRQIPAHVVDADLNGDTGDAGAMWIVGETFTDEANNIKVSVDSEMGSGFVVTITLGGESPTATFTSTPTPTGTSTHTPTSTPTDTPTNTPVPPTATPTATSTLTPTVTASLTPSATTTNEFEPEDINQDGWVNELDIRLCIDVFLGLERDPEIVTLADVNGDGMVDVLDVQAIYNAYLYE